MQDRPDGPLRILLVDDRLSSAAVWTREAARLDTRISLRWVDNSREMQAAILEGDWAAVLCHRSPLKISVSALLSLTQVLEPLPAVLLYPDLETTAACRGWLDAARKTIAAPARDDALGSMAVPSILGPTTSFLTSDAEAVRALRDSEERFRTLTEIAPVGIFLTDADQACIYVNERWTQITGVTASQATGRDWRDTLKMEGDALQATALFQSDPSLPLRFESHIERRRGEGIWVIGQMRPYLDTRGGIVGHLGVITDITDRKSTELAMQQSEKRLRELTAHITSAEERQRATIAREIHDDIGSSLTGMKIDVARLRQLTVDSVEAQEKLAAFTRLLDSVSASSMRIAKALRPSILDDGIVPAIDWQLREFGKRMGIDTEFNEPDEEPKLTADQSIALFRVVQEALNNVAKHAQARHVDIVLFAQPDELTLEIRDDGRGLPKEARTGDGVEREGGFGITGMRERILSLGGWVDVTGAPGKGTTVMVGIPTRMPA